jgi:hypothetical protein
MKTIEILLIWFFSLLFLGLLLKIIIEYIILKKFINNINKIYPSDKIDNKIEVKS